MRHRKYTFKIGRTSAHRRALLGNAVCSLIQAGRIRTTVAKAKEVRRLAEKMITLGKKGTLHARRLAIAKLHQPAVVAELFSDVAPRYQERNGGYTRIIRLGNRIGDGAEMCILELVGEPVTDAAGADAGSREAAAPTEGDPAGGTGEEAETA